MQFVMSFSLGGDQLVGVFDRATSKTGLLIVSGGNEIAIGPQRAMARLAKRISDAGYPVLRFDRRGVGDSDGINRGWASSREDILAALKCFPHIGVTRVVAFGNCDAATALATFDLPIAARVLGNPWLGEDDDALPPPAAIRARYRRRLFDPAAWRALLTGRIDLRRLVGGLQKASAPAGTPALAHAIVQGLARKPLPTTVVLAARDNTGIGFAAALKAPAFDAIRGGLKVETLDTDRHGFTNEADLQALAAILIRELAAVVA